jgi:hypothetical protein
MASVSGEIGGILCPDDDSSSRPTIKVTVSKDDIEKEQGHKEPGNTLYSVDADVYYDELTSSCAFRALLHPTEAGGSYTISARCRESEEGGVEEEITDNNISIATIRNVTFGDVWYCTGESNMALNLVNTMMWNVSLASIERYANIRILGMEGNMNIENVWSTAADAVDKGNFEKFSATCWYFAERLTDELRAQSDTPPPIGLVHTAWGGSVIEDWVDLNTLAKCDNICYEQHTWEIHETLFRSNIMPFVNMTIKGWVWYQGGSNMGKKSCVLGNSLRSSGYSCLAVALVALWRDLWSGTPGTTDPLAPFGVVALPHSISLRGNPEVGTMRLAQTGNYGILPNPAMPNTFLVQAYDVDDPFRNAFDMCDSNSCCEPAKCQDGNILPLFKHAGFECKMCPDLCGEYCASANVAEFFGNAQHPRTKKPIGSRLGLAAARTVYGVGGTNGGAATGPTLAGCAQDGPNVITLLFDQTLLAGDFVFIQEYNRSRPGLSKLEVLVKPADVLCLQTVQNECIDDGNGESHNLGLDTPWIAIEIITIGRATGFGYEVKADLSLVDGEVVAIRYAWQGTCCDDTNEPIDTLEFMSRSCPLGSCPIVAHPSGLPANPFLAKIVDGKCKCIPPQVCDADVTQQPFEKERMFTKGWLLVGAILVAAAIWASTRSYPGKCGCSRSEKLSNDEEEVVLFY